MKNKTLLIVILAGFLAACSQNPRKGFDSTSSGLAYKFHEKTENPAAEIGKILKMDMSYSLNDSLLFSSVQMQQPVYIQLMEPEYPGDIYEGFALMAPGDSVTFIVNAADFFLKTAQNPFLPEFAKESDNVFFQVRLLAAMSEEEYEEDMMIVAQEMMRQNEIRANMEDSLLEEYLQDNNINVEALESGLVYVEKQAGTGSRVQSGSRVSVHYEGRLLDGTVFDSSLERGQPIEFVVGVGQVIPGWDEGISKMRVGGKAQLIIPSYLAYGEHGAGNVIPPFSTLVFEVELLEVN